MANAFCILATPGSGYVLLHHVMGELEGVKGAWGYPEGGMGAVSNAIANSAQEAGAEIVVDSPVKKVLLWQLLAVWENNTSKISIHAQCFRASG